MATIKDVLNKTIPEAVDEIFKDINVSMAESTGVSSHYSMIAVIGFSGDKFGGALGFATEQTIIDAAHGNGNTLLNESWLGEVSNQLLGRVKNALLGYGVEIRMAIPMVLHGLELRVSDGNNKITQYEFTSKNGKACVWVDATWDVNRELKPSSSVEHAAPEGALVMF